MPTKRTTSRSRGQKLLPIPAKAAFIQAMDKALPSIGYPNRSQFIRDAICEKLAAMGHEIDRTLAQPPPRIGIGGRPRKQQRNQQKKKK